MSKYVTDLRKEVEQLKQQNKDFERINEALVTALEHLNVRIKTLEAAVFVVTDDLYRNI